MTPLNQHNSLDAALRLAQVLGETEPEPVQLLQRVVEVLGTPETQELLDLTSQIESDGGLLTRDGSRRRTPGGTFFWLVRDRLQQQGRRKELNRIFPVRRSKPAGPPRARKSLPLVAPPPVLEVAHRRKPLRNRPRRRPKDAVDRKQALETLHRPTLHQADIIAAVDQHLGHPADLRKRSVDPHTGTVTLHFDFPTVAYRTYEAAIKAAAEAAGVSIQVSPSVNQDALQRVARSLLPSSIVVQKYRSTASSTCCRSAHWAMLVQPNWLPSRQPLSSVPAGRSRCCGWMSHYRLKTTMRPMG
ncbi:MAG: hypothetical protein HC876_05600 [Chloroflexaceae bacterium]|nr:hypothetical protein [Chloroflexaceae bacterium]